jgi:hypothetical protein
MSAAAVVTKTPAATVMAGAKTNNNQLKAACAIGLLSNLETAQQERSVLLSDEQNLLEKKEKEGCA